ncbi:hypothetical protein ACX3YG_10145 [Pseudomonas wadenswilerensis]
MFITQGNGMIETMSELVAYTKKEAELFPSLASRIEIKPRGEAGFRLEDIPNVFPDSYLKYVNGFSFFKVSIGPFNLWPSMVVEEGMSNSLISANSMVEHWSDFLNSRFLCLVASFDADFICVGMRGSEIEGGVFLVDITSSPKWRVVDVASGFEFFLLLAANLMRLCDEHDGDVAEVLSEMDKVTRKFNCTEAQSSFWRSVAKELMA